jgi:hypothetical protein
MFFVFVPSWSMQLSLAIPGELFKQLSIADGPKYRLYSFELIELNKDVSFILLLPPVESFLADVEGSIDTYRSSATLMPISKRSIIGSCVCLDSHCHSSFEFTSWLSYQRELFLLQAALSSNISTETLRASHLLRNAFTNEEAVEAKASLARITDLQEKFASYSSLAYLSRHQSQCGVERSSVGG